MRRRLFFVFLISLFEFPFSAFGQTTTVTGQVKDVNGVPYAGATLKAQLVLAGAGLTGQATVTINNAQQCISAGQGSAPCKVPFQGTQGPITLDSGGNIPSGGLNLQDNTQVTPSGTQWLFSVTTQGSQPPLGTGPQACTATLTISGASQVVSSSFSGCPALSTVTPGSTPLVSSNPATCTVGQTFFNTTSGQFLLCIATNTVTTAAGYPATVIDPTLFGITNYRVRVADATWSTSNANVSCPNNDCNFVPTDTNLKCFGVIGGQYAFGNAVQPFTQTGAQTGTCGSVAAVNNATANGTFFLAADSTTPILNAVTALYALPRCGTFEFPMGQYLFLQSFPNPPASCAPGGYNRQLGVKFKGQGRQATTLVPGPGFNFTNGANTAVINTGNGGSIEGITIDGLGANLSGISTAPAATLVNIGAVTTQGGDDFFVDWASAASNTPIGLALQGQSFSFPNFNVFNFGKTGVSCGSNVILLGMYSSGTGTGLSTGANTTPCYDIGGAYCTNVSNIDCISVVTGGFFQGWGTYTQDVGAANEDSAAITGTFICDYCQFPGAAATQATKLGFKIFAGSKIYLRGTDVSGGSTGGALVSQTAGAGTIFNFGQNTSHSGPFLFSGTYVDLSGTFPTSGCTGTATSSSNIAVKISGLTAAGAGVPSTCTSTTADAGQVMKTSGTIFELLVNVSNTGSTVGSGVFTVTKNGVNTSMTCTIGNVNTACQDGAVAHFVSYVKGDLISIAPFPTGAAETLANAKVDLIAW